MEASGKARSLTIAGQVVGLFAALGFVVYVTGAFVLALRFGFENLPWDAVISELPREFVVGIGLTTVIIPAIAFATLYVGWRILKGGGADAPRLPRWNEATTRERAGVMGVAVAVALVLIAPGTIVELAKEGPRWELLWAIPALVLSTLWVLLVLNLRSRLAEKHDTRAKWNRLPTAATMATLAGACVIPGCVMVGATLPLQDVKICTTAGAEETGSLVGETGDKIYFGGGADDTPPRQIHVRLYSRIDEVFFGEEAHDTSCPPVRSGDED